MKAGFIGLGQMGGPIAVRLARCGFEVTGCDISPEALAAFDEPGTLREADPLETARASGGMLGVCVRTDAQLESLAGDGVLFAALGEGGTFIMHSTVDPALARRLGEKATEFGVGFIDVGVSGGGPAVLEGKLSLFVGGEEAVVARARPWLDAIGVVAHLGPVGRGMEAKLLNNLVSIANYGMSAAIVDLGDKLGFDRQQLVDALMAGSAQSFALKVGPGLVQPRGDDPLANFASLHDLLKKDVEHARILADPADPSLRALLASCESMLDSIERAAALAGRATSPA